METTTIELVFAPEGLKPGTVEQHRRIGRAVQELLNRGAGDDRLVERVECPARVDVLRDLFESFDQYFGTLDVAGVDEYAQLLAVMLAVVNDGGRALIDSRTPFGMFMKAAFTTEPGHPVWTYARWMDEPQELAATG